MLQRIIFILITLLTAYWAYKAYSRIVRNIRLGRHEEITGDEGRRWRNVFLVAFGQKKMFSNWLPAIFHFFIYVAFLFTQIELIEILVDGFFGVHRFFADKLGMFYTVVISSIELLSVLAFIATIVFLARRNLLKVPRFRKPEMTTWPRLDANLILLGEIVLIVGIFMMNGADTVLQQVDPAHYKDTGRLAISGWLGPFLFEGFSKDGLVLIERLGWWLHLLIVYAFILYLPISKHLHIVFAFPNTYFARLQPQGKMENMPEIMQEVKTMLGLAEDSGNASMMEEELPDFGAKDIFDLSWKTLLDAYSCTECGRCTAVCPANLTGKTLSPRKIVMDIRDRVEEVGQKIDSGEPKYIAEKYRNQNGHTLTARTFDDGKSLFDYISDEELHACTTCQACVEACPVLINPLEPILQMRRYQILTLSQGPQDWMPMFTSLENNGSVWQMSESRSQWTEVM